MSARKPFDSAAGYVCSLRAPFGHVVVYDRARGGDWIDAGPRWVVAAYDHDKRNIALLDCESQRVARRTMKDARNGDHDWIEQRTEDPPPTPPAPAGEPNGTMVVTIATGETVTLPLDDKGQSLPRLPHNESYMRGWNQVLHRHTPRRTGT